jgi:ComF family protein
LALNLIQYFQGLISIVYPHACPACGNVLFRNENILCMNCYAELPKTGFQNDAENELARLFWGRITVKNAAAFIYFNKGSRYRNILHELKYKGQQNLGFEMGRLFGLELRETSFSETDMIIPVPLHNSKMRKRGYNQSEFIARGISAVLKIPVQTDLISRTSETKTQTNKSRYERWENVRDTFRVEIPELLSFKHLMLVDDVITTGATIEACAAALLAVEGVTLSIASLAYANLQ